MLSRLPDRESLHPQKWRVTLSGRPWSSKERAWELHPKMRMDWREISCLKVNPKPMAWLPPAVIFPMREETLNGKLRRVLESLSHGSPNCHWICNLTLSSLCQDSSLFRARLVGKILERQMRCKIPQKTKAKCLGCPLRWKVIGPMPAASTRIKWRESRIFYRLRCRQTLRNRREAVKLRPTPEISLN